MAGYGNRTAPDYTASAMGDEQSSTRLNLTDSHSAPTYGAGFGNKRASQPSISPTSSADTQAGAESTHFDTQTRHGSAPYSNAHTYGSASTAGAGWGNKTGSFSSGSGDGIEHHDSTVGKMMEKVGGVLHSPALVRKGQAKSGGDADARREEEQRLPPAN